jgi:hypothetical protein
MIAAVFRFQDGVAGAHDISRFGIQKEYSAEIPIAETLGEPVHPGLAAIFRLEEQPFGSGEEDSIDIQDENAVELPDGFTRGLAGPGDATVFRRQDRAPVPYRPPGFGIRKPDRVQIRPGNGMVHARAGNPGGSPS